MWEHPDLHHSPTQQVVFSPRIPISAVSLSHPHFPPLLLPFSLLPQPKGRVFSLSLCTPHPLTSCPVLAPSPRSAPSSQERLCLLSCPAASPPATLLLLLGGTTAKPCSSRGDRATSQLRHSMAGAGGTGSPHHTHTLAAKPIYTSPCGCLVQKCQDSQQGSEPCCWWEPSQPSREAGAGAQCEPRASPHPSLQGVRSTHVGPAPGWFHPTCFRLKATEKTKAGRRASLAQGVSRAEGASPTWLVLR